MKFKNILGILIVVGLIVTVSGCTSQSGNNSTYSIEVDGNPRINGPLENGTSNSNPYYGVDIPIRNTGSTNYKSFDYVITGYDESGNVIGEYKNTYQNLKAGESNSITIDFNPTKEVKLVKVDLKVLNVTTV